MFFFHYKSLETLDIWGLGQFEPDGLDWQDLCRGLLDIAAYLVYKPWDEGF